MDGLPAAITTAAIALLAKLYIDWLERHRERRAVAAAIAGELTAYLTLTEPVEFVANLRNFENVDVERLRTMLAAFPALPTAHPIFDKVSDKLGRLPVQEVADISAAYNVVTGVRLQMSKWPSAEFLSADRTYQIILFRTIATKVEKQARLTVNLITRLEWISRQGSWSNFLVGSDPPTDLPVTKGLTNLLSPGAPIAPRSQP